MIREPAPADFPAIRAVLRHAFGTTDEANLVEQLRDDGDMLIELVEATDIAVQACIQYSRLTIETGSDTINAAALAPVAVLPAFQNKGIGAALIEAGNARVKALGLDAIIVLGHETYYPRFGFSAEKARVLDAPFSGPHFMALELKAGALARGGAVRYAKAFGL